MQPTYSNRLYAIDYKIQTTLQAIAYNFGGFENFPIFISVPPLEIEQGRK